MLRAQSAWPSAIGHSHRPSRHALLNVLTILLPPLAVKMAGEGGRVPLNMLLTLCGWIPGVIHARRIVARATHHDFAADQLVIALRHHVRR